MQQGRQLGAGFVLDEEDTLEARITSRPFWVGSVYAGKFLWGLRFVNKHRVQKEGKAISKISEGDGQTEYA